MRYTSTRNFKYHPRLAHHSPSSNDLDTPGRIRPDLTINSFLSSRLGSHSHRFTFSPIRVLLTVVTFILLLSFLSFSRDGNIKHRPHFSTTTQEERFSTGIHQSGVKGETHVSKSNDLTQKPLSVEETVNNKVQTISTVSTTTNSNELLSNSNPSGSAQKEKEIFKKEETAHVSEKQKFEVKRESTTLSTSIKQNDSFPNVVNASIGLGPEVPVVTESKQTRRSRAKAFIVVFLGHSGSTAFITELRNHPEFDIEYLEPLDHDEYEFNTELSLKKAREILDKSIAKGKIPGFKLRPFHIRNKPEEFQKLAKEYDLRIFWQFRVNVMKQAIGEYRHRVLNDSSVVEGLKKNEKACDESNGYNCQFRIDDLPALHRLLNNFSVNDDILGEAVRLLKRDGDMMAVKYEDYLYRREEVMKDTFDFLGVDHKPTEPLRSKASPDSLCGMVLNFQEVCRAFYACQLWRPYLDDDRNRCYCRPTNGGNFDQRYCHREVWYQKRT